MWTPEQSSLERLVDLLDQSQVPDSSIQKKVSEEINQLSENPEIYNYLAYISCLESNDSPIPLKTKNVAGVVLKGMIERNYQHIAPQNLHYVKMKLVEAFNYNNKTIQNVSTLLFEKLGSQQWPEFSQLLMTNLNSDNTEFINISLKHITRILEDFESTFGTEEESDFGLLAELAPKLLLFCTSAWQGSIQESALKSLNSLATMMPDSFVQNIDNYLNILFESASNSQNPNLRMLSCKGFYQILSVRRDLVNVNLERFLETLLKLTLDTDNQVRKEAVLIWNEFFIGDENGFGDRQELFQSTLTILMPALLDCLQYSEEDMLEDENAKQSHSMHIEEDDDEEEKDPFEDDEGANEDEDEDEDEDDGNTFKYTLRKEAACLMEILVRHFEQDAFSKVQSKLEQYLGNENDWITRESAILCLGALARGAFESITAHFEHLFPFLLQSLESNEGLLRSTTCWTLSRFKSWIVNHSRNEPDIMRAYLPAILKLMTTDDNFKVQQASCSALASLCSEGPEFVEESINDVIQAIAIALDKYENRKILGSVYDAIGAIAINLSSETIQSDAVEPVLMEALSQKWSEDNILIEAVDSMVSVLGQNAKKYADTFIKGAFNFINSYIEKRNEGGYNKKQLYRKREIATRCIELFNTFLETLKNDAQQFINSENFFDIFQECIKDEDALLRQSILASVSGVVKNCPHSLNNYVDKIAEALSENLKFDSPPMECLNNAAFAVGESAVAYGHSLHKYISDFATKISHILCGKVHRSVGKTLACAIGRLGLVSPDDVWPFLKSCLKQFCLSMSTFNVRDLETQQALTGALQMILKDPQVSIEHASFVFFLLSEIDQSSGELHQLASQVLHHFINSAGGGFPVFLEQLPPQVKKSLAQNFGITSPQ